MPCAHIPKNFLVPSGSVSPFQRLECGYPRYEAPKPLSLPVEDPVHHSVPRLTSLCLRWPILPLAGAGIAILGVHWAMHAISTPIPFTDSLV